MTRRRVWRIGSSPNCRCLCACDCSRETRRAFIRQITEAINGLYDSNYPAGDSNDITQCVEFPDIRIQIPWKVYAEQIVGFAAEARAFFKQGIEKDKSVETIEGEYDAFWSEYHHLLESWDEPCERDLIRDGSDTDYHP